MARMNRPAPVEITYKNMRFLITHNPTNATLGKFIEVSFERLCWGGAWVQVPPHQPALSLVCSCRS